MPTFQNKVTLRDAFCLRSTEKAILVAIEGEQVWIPQSQIDDDSEVWRQGDEGDLIVSEWIAQQKEISPE